MGGAKKQTRSGKAKTTSKAKPGRKGSTSVGGVPLSAKEARAALDREARIITRLRKDVDKNAWRIGRRLAQIAALGLHKAAKFDTLEAYAQHAFGFARSATFQYMRVSGAFSEELAETFGIEKLDRGLLYIAKTPEPETARDIPTLHIRVPDDAGHVTEKPFADVNVPELRAATQHEAKAQGKGKRKKTPSALALEPHVKPLAEANRSVDRIVGASNAARADITMRTADGVVLVDLRGLPIGDLAACLAAVAKAFRKRR